MHSKSEYMEKKKKKNRFIMLSLILCCGYSLYAQQVSYMLYGKYACCNPEIEPIPLYDLEKDSIFYTNNVDKPVFLPDTGRYVLTSAYISGEVEVFIYHKGENVDTLIRTGIQEAIEITPGKKTKNFDGWFCFGQKCNGYQRDYYNNGNVYIEGDFKKGKARGEIKMYSPTGELELSIYYDRKGRELRRKYHNVWNYNNEQTP